MNEYVKRIDKEGIRKFFKMALEYEDVLSLTIGEPDFSTPFHIREVAMHALQQGKTWYAPVEGFSALKVEISTFYKRKYNIDYDPEKEVLVTVGASEALDLAFRSYVNKDDEVLVFQPAFVSYEPLAQLTGAKVIAVETYAHDNFIITPQLLLQHLTSKTKAIILSYPNNPTGATMNHQEYQALVPILENFNGIIVSDEIYSELTYDHKHASLAHFDSIKHKVIVINGFSKAYAMTGWRLGYVCAHASLLEPMVRIHQYSLMCASSVSQFAGIEALKNGDENIAMMKQEYLHRQGYVVSKIKSIGLDVIKPRGAFYVFVDIRSTSLSSEEFANQLLEQQHVAVIPGVAFGKGGEGFVRISYSYSLPHLKTALEKIHDFVKSL